MTKNQENMFSISTRKIVAIKWGKGWNRIEKSADDLLKHKIKHILILAIPICILSGCTQDSNTHLNTCSSDFYYSVSKPDDDLSGEVTFTFYEQYYNECADSIPSFAMGLKIVISEKDSVFSLSDSIKNKFYYTYSYRGEFYKREPITEGEVKGVLIGDDLWRVSANTEHFDFSVLLDSKTLRRSDYNRTKCVSERLTKTNASTEKN
jgi:hypothetical protein